MLERRAHRTRVSSYILQKDSLQALAPYFRLLLLGDVREVLPALTDLSSSIGSPALFAQQTQMERASPRKQQGRQLISELHRSR